MWVLKWFFLLIFFISCQDNNSDKLLHYANEGLIMSTNRIKDENTKIFDLLQLKKFDVSYAEVTELWEPKAKITKLLSESLQKEIYILKDSINFINIERIQKFHNELVKYRKVCEEVNEVLKMKLEDNPIIKENELLKFLQEKSQNQNIILTLNTIENSVINMENEVLKFCNNSSDYIRDDFSISTSVMVNQNSKHLKAGEILEVNAGVGIFSRATMPKFFIAGKEYPVTKQGVLEYKLIAPNEIGKHIVPMTITYIQQDGLKETVEYKLEYFVDP